MPLPAMRRLAMGFLLSCSCAAVAAAPRGVILADFESGEVDLRSYGEGQDNDPNAWELTDQNTFQGSLYSLRLYGNSWKAQAISPYHISRETVLRIAVYTEEIGEMQAFGIDDGTNVLFYTFAGTQLPTGESWEVTYQGAFPMEVWNVYYLPVGRDWDTRFGYEPDVTDLVYVNDRDETPRGITLFDEVIDVTEDLPVAPEVEIVRGRQRVQQLSERLFRVGIHFHSQVYDPDSDTFTYHWDFGDSTFSGEGDPFHEFVVEADYTYTVTLGVRDETGLWGRDSAQVAVEPGEPEGPVRMNFVGDVMLARRYEEPGGVIFDYGPEEIFVATRPFFGDAAEISVCNLESPLTDEGEPHPTKLYVFRGNPENVAGITYAGIDLVTLGNNHIVDYGQRGMEETQEVLDAEGIRWSGAGDNEYLARLATFWTEDGIALAFLGQCNRTGREWNYQPFLDAAYNKPGFSYLIEPNLTESIAAVRGLVDLVVIQAHAGTEYATDPGDLLGLPVEAPIDAPGPWPGMVDFRFQTRPSLSDRQLRWRAVESGADLVVCHHPHVLQGFEVYQGVVIAHSLGNFAFDQTFAETFPSMILYTEFDKSGFLSFTFRPVFIDDMIPRMATGRLGREILDRIADYSRELDTVVGVNPIALVGTVYVDPDTVVWTESIQARTIPLAEEDGWWVSLPIERDGTGTLSQILDVDLTGAVEVRWGREILWHGGFEAEGATLWNLNSEDERYDEDIVLSGLRSLRQHRDPGNSGAVNTDLEGNLSTSGGSNYSVSGWIRTENALEAGVSARFYQNRWGSPLVSVEAGDPISGTHDWTWVSQNFQVPPEAGYFNVRCHMERPQSGDGYAWYDDFRLVEWEDWQSGALPLPVSYPNNLRFVQVRTTAPSDSAAIRWVELVPGDLAAGVDEGTGVREARIVLGPTSPNPFNSRTTIEYLLPRAAKVRLEIFDVAGRLISLLDNGVRPAGRHQVVWEAQDASSGLYFCRLKAGAETVTRKIVHLK